MLCSSFDLFLTGEVCSLQEALEDCAHDLKTCEAKWKEAVIEGAKLSEEIHLEQVRARTQLIFCLFHDLTPDLVD